MFNKVTCFLVRCITETLKCLNFLIMGVGAIGLDYSKKDDFKLIALSGLVLYVFTTISVKIANKYSKLKRINLIIFISLSLLSSFFIIKNLQLQYMPYCTVYFLVIILYALFHYNNEIDNFNGFIRKYAFGMIPFLILLCGMQELKIFEVIKIYAPMYLIMSILYIIQVNIMQRYSNHGVNLINGDRNIRRFNVMSMVVTISSICIFTSDLLKNIYTYASYIVELLIYIIIKPASIILIYIYKIGLFGLTAKGYDKIITKNKDNKDVMKQLREKIEEENISLHQQNETVSTVIKFIVITIFIIIICILIYAIYRRFMKMQIKTAQLDELDGEERSFEFKKDEQEKGKRKRGKENLKDLHVIRRIYIDVVKILKGKGIEYKNSYTPNEYNLAIENTEFKSKNISELANIYNHLRYGNKSISKEDIDKAYKIKKNLDNN